MKKTIIIILCSTLLLLVNAGVAMSRNIQLNVQSRSGREAAVLAEASGNDFGEKRTAEADKNANNGLLQEIKLELEQVNRLTSHKFNYLPHSLSLWP
jgi:hypothetical protein